MPTTFDDFARSFRDDHQRIISFSHKLSAEVCIKWVWAFVASILSLLPRLGGGVPDRNTDGFRDQLTKYMKAIRQHGNFEEKIFYPLLRRKLGEKAPIDETEHGQVEALLMQLSEEKSLSEQLKLMKKLRSIMVSHFNNEEINLLPAAHEVITERECWKMNRIFKKMIGRDTEDQPLLVYQNAVRNLARIGVTLVIMSLLLAGGLLFIDAPDILVPVPAFVMAGGLIILQYVMSKVKKISNKQAWA